MEKVVAAGGLILTLVFFGIVFFFGMAYFWGIFLGLAITGFGCLFCEE